MTSVPHRLAWWLAAASGLAAGAFAGVEGHAWWLVVLATVGHGAAVWLASRTPWPGVLLIAGVVVGLGVLGLRTDASASALVPQMAGLFVVGYLLPWRSGIWALPVLAVADLAVGPWDEVGSIAFMAVVVSLPWAFGQAVRARDLARQAALDEAEALALVDPGTRAEAVALATREEHVSTMLALIGEAVGRMNAVAAQARDSLDPRAIEHVRSAGREATASLKELLLVLRGDAAAPEEVAWTRDDVRRPGGAGTSWRGRLGLWAPAVVVALLWALLLGVAPERFRPGGPASLLALVVAIGALLVRTRWPAAANLVIAALGPAMLAGWLDFETQVQWLAVAVLATAWAAGRAGTRRALGAWAVQLLVFVGLVLVVGSPENLAIEVVVHVLPYLAGTAWAGHLAAESEHRRVARRRRAEIEVGEQEAELEARLGLARDLHDVASHAVGTMMMQAGAALVSLDRDPEAARAALDTAARVGRETLAALASVGADSGAGRSAGLADRLAAIAASAGSTGTVLTMDEPLPVGLAAAHEELVVRVVREAVANVVRHAPGARVDVDVEAAPGPATGDGTITVRVTNGPGTGTLPPAPGTGHGLRGLHELLASRDGRLETGPTADGGWRVEACFPAYGGRGRPEPESRPVEEATA